MKRSKLMVLVASLAAIAGCGFAVAADGVDLGRHKITILASIPTQILTSYYFAIYSGAGSRVMSVRVDLSPILRRQYLPDYDPEKGLILTMGLVKR